MNFEVYILRIGHRLLRDKRITTHVGLVARAFGARGIILDYYDEKVFNSIKYVCKNWGGDFLIDFTEDPNKYCIEWKAQGGEIIHLTMYGLNLPQVINDIKNSQKRKKLIIVGAEKVPRFYYEIADWNVAIGNQPHSEVAALAVFLLKLFDEWVFNSYFENAKIRILPSQRGKHVIKVF
ncbi:MAG: tRNA (cytidine(56)-2'-O)-methyltransferase [Candidatus Methanomethylicia archaeon]|nr:tRNA (cytidine(56)-2'-O)-methyltransferase [Candidatus Methanomethylicia archaeon]MCX8169088.1 tRNA (cytidine(56)-2'-O)-methyltransferase [Candidatus Methanomethylicia archaeon]MDW7988820.1 tRNA (cytidine(56)-2'-O)-methyltransferase [Nitrososphaerota archaeon]